MAEVQIIWTDYTIYRCRLRGFDLAEVESVIRHSEERYLDTAAGGRVVVGRYKKALIMIPYEAAGGRLTPVTVHMTTRPQIKSRVKSGRFMHE